jgi:hypothetical protein
MASPTDIEKESLEAHVELCAIRYNSLDEKLDNLEVRIDKLERLILDIKTSISTSNSDNNKQTISIFTSMMGVILAGLIGFIAHGIFK